MEGLNKTSVGFSDKSSEGQDKTQQLGKDLIRVFIDFLSMIESSDVFLYTKYSLKE